MTRTKPKRLPVLMTDEDAERFIETADLSEYDLSGFRPMRFEFESHPLGPGSDLP